MSSHCNPLLFSGTFFVLNQFWDLKILPGKAKSSQRFDVHNVQNR